MENIYLSNAFSMQMLDLSSERSIKVIPVTAEEVSAVDFISCVGHLDTANILTGMLGKEVAFNRVSLKLEEGDVLYVAQVTGGRLPEGATSLPEGTSLTFLKVTIE